MYTADSEHERAGNHSQSEVDASITNGLPAFVILPFLNYNNAIPSGWAICDGGLHEGSGGVKYRVPRLGGVYLRGVLDSKDVTEAVKEPTISGQDEVRLNLAHNHSGALPVSPNYDYRIVYSPSIGVPPGSNDGSRKDHEHSIPYDLQSLTVDVQPRHWNVLYIIKLP